MIIDYYFFLCYYIKNKNVLKNVIKKRNKIKRKICMVYINRTVIMIRIVKIQIQFYSFLN